MDKADKRIKKGQETKGNILGATVTLFSQKGYDGTSIKDITDLAGIPKSLFYHYFKTKEEVLQHLIQSYSLRLTDEEKAVVRTSVQGSFEEITAKFFKTAASNKDMIKIMVQEALRDQGVLDALLHMIGTLSEDFRSQLPQLADGEVEARVFSFYFRFIPLAYFTLTKNTFSEHFGISVEELDGCFLKLMQEYPYIDRR